MTAQLQAYGLLSESNLRVLLVLREGSTLGPIGAHISSAGYSLCQVSSWKEVLLNFPFARPDLILLNVSVPDTSGKQILRQLRAWTTAPIIVISNQSDQWQRIEFLDMGADDYVTKPLDMGEFLARLRAASRRAFGVPRHEIFRSGGLEVDFSRREVRVQQRPVKLTATEYDLLKVLAGHAGQVQAHYQLIHELWGGTHYQDAQHLLRVTVSNLRRKLLAGSRLPSQIVTEPGIGYSLRCEAQQPPPHETPAHFALSFDTLFRRFPEPMILLSAEGVCLSANHACQSLFQANEVDIFRQNPWDLQRFRAALNQNDSVKNFHLSSQMNCALTATAWRDQDSRLIGYAVMIQPATNLVPHAAAASPDNPLSPSLAPAAESRRTPAYFGRHSESVSPYPAP
jgi:two-component system KDP operon response regulator KdpE